MKTREPRYLGDAVYAQFDGYGVVLTTGGHLGSGQEDQHMTLEPAVLESLNEYVDDLKAALADAREP